MFSRERPVWAVETPVLLPMEPEKVESVGRRSEDENCVFGRGVQAGYLDSGDSTFGGFGCRHISTYSIIENIEPELPLGGEFGFFKRRHERGR